MELHEKLNKEIKRREYYNSMAPFPVYDTDIINDMKSLSERVKMQDFNNEPICYCKTCLSIQIKTVKFPEGPNGEKRDVDYCLACSNTELAEAHITEWEDMYEERYGERFLDKKSKDKK